MAMRNPPLPKRGDWTFSALEAMPEDGKRYEILDGELIEMPPPSATHQRAAMRLTVLIGPWCRAHTGWTVLSPAGVYINEKNWFEPDLAVYPDPESRELDWRQLSPPLLVVEVLSPSTSRHDRQNKRPRYLSSGVHEVWLLDRDTRSVERWTAHSTEAERITGGITWKPVSHAPALDLTDADLFNVPQ
jgi:Uma2 family endonuclease